ncbi:SGNH/GDSL hydrolase family protein [Paenibacillus doosanensis]|nr:SGNH/GDSL hydrolase family protein [Paenibacillus doosanensis]
MKEQLSIPMKKNIATIMAACTIACTIAFSGFTATAAASAPGPVHSFYESSKSGKRIDFVGDSTTEAAAAMFDRLKSKYALPGGPLEGAVLQNRGTSGITLHNFVNNSSKNGNTLDQAVADQADLYILSYGINDIRGSSDSPGRSPEQIRADLQIAVDRLLHETNGAVLLRIPNPFLTQNVSSSIYLSPIENAQLYSDQLWEVYKSFEGYDERVDVLDIPNLVFGRKAMPHHPLMNDTIHPAAAGYEAIADAIADRLSGKMVVNELPMDAYLQESPVSKTLSIFKPENLFNDIPAGGAAWAIAKITPQILQVVAQKGEFYKVKTWLGEKWINPEGGALEIMPSKPDESLELKSTTFVFDDPYTVNMGKGSGFLLTPQTVKVLARWHGYAYWKNEWYYQIQTVLGPKWITLRYSLPADVKPVQEPVEVKRVTDLNVYPWDDAYKLGQITPQKVTAFEKGGDGWYHIHSWAGDAWIKI